MAPKPKAKAAAKAADAKQSPVSAKSAATATAVTTDAKAASKASKAASVSAGSAGSATASSAAVSSSDRKQKGGSKKGHGKAGATATATAAAAANGSGSDDDAADGAAAGGGGGVVIATYSESKDATPPALLSRDDFRESCFARDGRTCVLCRAAAAVDAHHIVERKLFRNGGYFLENAASVCGACHLLVEQTVRSCGAVRRAAGIRRVVLPDACDPARHYDKWGNEVVPPATAAERDAQRTAAPDVDHEAVSWPRRPGPLFLADNVQKVLKSCADPPLLELFSD